MSQDTFVIPRMVPEDVEKALNDLKENVFGNREPFSFIGLYKDQGVEGYLFQDESGNCFWVNNGKVEFWSRGAGRF